MGLFFILSFSMAIITKWKPVSTLECQYCSSLDFNSPCRLGTEENTKTCSPGEGDDACYEEYLIGKRKSDVPLYRRGCAPKDWCDTQKANHGTDLKFCNTCQDDKCNKDVFGSPDNSTFMCFKCSSTDGRSSCKTGGQDLATTVCEPNEKICTARYYDLGLGNSEYERKCGNKGYCRSAEIENGICEECEFEL